MAIPDYQSLMLPVLKIAADGKEHQIRDTINQLANQFGLSDAERKQMLASGLATLFDDRREISFASTTNGIRSERLPLHSNCSS